MESTRSTNQQVILVVDDEQNICKALQRILEAEGYQVITTLDGQSALDIVPKLQPNLILLDIMMPGMDGREVCSKVHEICDARVVYFSARTDLAKQDKSKELAEGADAFLPKPSSSKRILSVVETILTGK